MKDLSSQTLEKHGSVKVCVQLKIRSGSHWQLKENMDDRAVFTMGRNMEDQNKLLFNKTINKSLSS